MDNLQVQEKNRKFKNGTIVLFVIMVLIALLFALSGCSINKNVQEQVYIHHMIEEGYLLINHKIDKFEDWRTHRLCDKLNKDFKYLNYRIDTEVYKNGKPYKYKFKTYIYVTKEDFDKTKTNIFGKENFIINRNLRKKYQPQIE